MNGRWPRNTAPGEVMRTVLLAGLIAALLACSVAMVAAATTIDIGPKVGDILVFRPGARMPAGWEFTATTASEPSTTCSACVRSPALVRWDR